MIPEDDPVGLCIGGIIEIRKFTHVIQGDIEGLPVHDSRCIGLLGRAVHVALPALLSDARRDPFLRQTVDQGIVRAAEIEAVIEQAPDRVEVQIQGAVKPAGMHLGDQIFIDDGKIVLVPDPVVFIQVRPLIGIHIVVVIKLAESPSQDQDQKYSDQIRNGFLH